MSPHRDPRWPHGSQRRISASLRSSSDRSATCPSSSRLGGRVLWRRHRLAGTVGATLNLHLLHRRRLLEVRQGQLLCPRHPRRLPGSSLLSLPNREEPACGHTAVGGGRLRDHLLRLRTYSFALGSLVASGVLAPPCKRAPMGWRAPCRSRAGSAAWVGIPPRGRSNRTAYQHTHTHTHTCAVPHLHAALGSSHAAPLHMSLAPPIPHHAAPPQATIRTPIAHIHAALGTSHATRPLHATIRTSFARPSAHRTAPLRASISTLTLMPHTLIFTATLHASIAAVCSSILPLPHDPQSSPP